MTRDKRFLVLLTCLATLCCAPASAIAETLTNQGLAPVRLGMTIAAAQRALHAKLGRLSRSSHGFSTEPEAIVSCWLWSRRDEQNSSITYMTERGRIVRIDVAAASGTTTSLATTARGIGVGSALDDVEKAYGASLHLEPHPLEEDTQWALVEGDGSAGIRLEVRDGAVTAMFAASGPALEYSEACS